MPLLPPPGVQRPVVGAPPVPSAALQAWVAQHYAKPLRAGVLMGLARNPTRAQQLLSPVTVAPGVVTPPKLGTSVVTPGMAGPQNTLANPYSAFPDYAQTALKQMDADKIAAQNQATTTAAWLSPALQGLQQGQQQAQSAYASTLAGLYGNVGQIGPGQVSATSPGGIVSSGSNYAVGAAQQAAPLQGAAQQQMGAVNSLLGNLKVGDLGAGAMGNLAYTASQIPTVFAAKKSEYMGKLSAAMADAQATQAASDAKLAQDQTQFEVTNATQLYGIDTGLKRTLIGTTGKAGTTASGLKPSSSLLPLASGAQPNAGYQAYTAPDGSTYQIKKPSTGSPGKPNTGSGGVMIPGPKNADLIRQGYTAARVPGGWRYIKPGATSTGGAAYQKAVAGSVETVRKLSEGVSRAPTAAEIKAGIYQPGDRITENVHDPEEIFPQLLAQGIRPVDAYRVISTTTGKRIGAQAVYNGLRTAGVAAPQAEKLAKQFTGQNVPSLGSARDRTYG